jgi:hypothetical protein
MLIGFRLTRGAGLLVCVVVASGGIVSRAVIVVAAPDAHLEG